MKMNAKGLVIKVNNVGEKDRALSVLTEDKGIIRAYANGARNIKSKKMAATGLLCYSDFTFASQKENYRVEEATAINIFYRLRSNIEALMLAEYFCELCSTFIEEEQNDREYLPLILNSVAFLENGKRPPRLIKAITELRLVTLAGYMPDLTGCGCDGKHLPRFDVAEGILLCKNCCEDGKDGVLTLNETVVTAMRYITSAPPEKLYNFSIPESDTELLCRVCESFILTRAEKNLHTLKYYNQMRTPEINL